MFAEDIGGIINNYRIDNDLGRLFVSSNLSSSAEKHLDYLIEKGIISHKGRNNSDVNDRAVEEGATALLFGEVIGYSPTIEELFNSWLESPTHYAVIKEKSWNWFGYSIKKYKGVYVAVVNFSTGNLGSTKLRKTDGGIVLTGNYIVMPSFNSPCFKIDYVKDNKFRILINEGSPYIIDIKGADNVISDRLELFF